jgi:kumamolisin
VISNPTPVDLAKAYQFPRSNGTDAQQGYGACVAIVELGGGWTTQNLNSTFGRIGLPNPTVVDVSVDGGTNNPSDIGASGEVMLDIYCVGAVSPAAKIAMYFAPNSFQGFVDCITAATNDTTNNPSVISISWGTVDSNWGNSNITLFEAALQASVAKGITTFVAIGDYGTQAISGGATYTVQYPGTSNYVVSSGGTVISINNNYTIASEVVWNTPGAYGTGGGISSIFTIPSWQTGQGFSYTNINNVTTSLTTRGVPDVSTMATGYQFYYGSGNSFGSFVGTSAVAPLLAGLMARLNQLSGRRIGFVNADWYGIRTTAFNDIVTGNNAVPNTLAGYKATTSWDACTGIGSPIGNAIFSLYNVGSTYPTQNLGFRPTTGQTYPRIDIQMGP